MTRKDYILIAEALRYDYETVAQGFEVAKGAQRTYLQGRKEGIESVTSKMADCLETGNPRFDREHFLAVVRGEKELNSKPERKVGA